jgi:hypothetical protein
MQFMLFVMLSQLWKEKSKNEIEIPETFSKGFSNWFLELSMRNYTWLIRAIGNIFAEKNKEWFKPELKDNFDKTFYNALDYLVPERNEIGHYQINLT